MNTWGYGLYQEKDSQKQRQQKHQQNDYAGQMEREARARTEGKFKPFHQGKFRTCWVHMGSAEGVTRGVCRALSAAYLCRQYTSRLCKDSDRDITGDQLQFLVERDPLHAASSLGRFFQVFREGRPGKWQKRYETGSSLSDPYGGKDPREHVKWLEPGAKYSEGEIEEKWRVHRVDQVFKAHGQTADSDRFGEGQMLETMQHFSKVLESDRYAGQHTISLEKPNTTSILCNQREAYLMCWVPTHCMALAVHLEGWRGYKVKFFDPNYGECKFKELADFDTFLSKICEGFNKIYRQTHGREYANRVHPGIL